MDLIKIGHYIAEKRKALGLTQRDLAEQLSMSDKSVSKWERGVCLPDVSVYAPLCTILGISIHAFLAGEDLPNLPEKSESTLMQVVKDGWQRAKNLKAVIAVLLALTILAGTVLGVLTYRHLTAPKNYIAPFAQDSAEMSTAQLLSGTNNAFLFQYTAKDAYRTLTVYLSEYQFGKLTAKNSICTLSSEDIPSSINGIIALVPSTEEASVRLIVADEYAKYDCSYPILDSAADITQYLRCAEQAEDTADICFGKEQGLAALHYGADGVEATSIFSIENGYVSQRNDYTYYISVLFE